MLSHVQGNADCAGSHVRSHWQGHPLARPHGQQPASSLLQDGVITLKEQCIMTAMKFIFGIMFVMETITLFWVTWCP